MILDNTLKKDLEEALNYKLESEVLLGEDIEDIFIDLIAEIHKLKEELKDLKEDLEENYRRIPVSEQVGISDRDFI